VLLLLPADPLRPRLPDPHFAPEFDAAQEAGLSTALLDHDALVAGAASESVSRVPEADDVVYRGWMVSAAQYASLETALGSRGSALRTSAEGFQRAHELPGWYASLSDFTPETVWSEGRSADPIDDLCQKLGTGAAVLRDYVKSMKHYWSEACYVPDVLDRQHSRKVAARFIALREDSFTGGLVLRRYESFQGAEVRTWWVDGVCALTTAHPDTSDVLPPDDRELPDLSEVVPQLALPFVTIDFAQRADGAWRVIELGDGQVSDRPSSTPPASLVEILLRRG
jgi:hypothetical protein